MLFEFPGFRHVLFVVLIATTGKNNGYSGVQRWNVGVCQVLQTYLYISYFTQQWLKCQTFLNKWTTKVAVTYYKALLLARSRGSSVSTVTKLRATQYGLDFRSGQTFSYFQEHLNRLPGTMYSPRVRGSVCGGGDVKRPVP